MVAKLREILLTQYIGSILIALLVLQAAVEVVTRIARIGFWTFNRVHSESVLGGYSRNPFSWENFAFSLVSAALYLLAAYLLARWLFPAPIAFPHDGDPTPALDQQEQE